MKNCKNKEIAAALVEEAWRYINCGINAIPDAHAAGSHTGGGAKHLAQSSPNIWYTDLSSMANVSSKKFTRKFPWKTQIRVMQEIMQFILQFCRQKTARSIVLRCFAGDIAAFPSFAPMHRFGKGSATYGIFRFLRAKKADVFGRPIQKNREQRGKNTRAVYRAFLRARFVRRFK